MTWSTSADVEAFLAVAGDFLCARPVEHTVLLTEAAYLRARPSSAPDQRYGWWQGAGGRVEGAFLQAPNHPPVLSLVPDEALGELAHVLGDAEAIGVDGSLVTKFGAAWKRCHGTDLVPRSRITLYRLDGPVTRPLPRGNARTAGAEDRDLLLDWYQRLMEKYPGDPSEAAYVVDDPLSFGGITLWEVDGAPVAMAGRSRLVAGMVRLSAVYAPDDEAYATAAFTAACVAAQRIAEHVLVFGAAAGGEPCADRVMLAPDR